MAPSDFLSALPLALCPFYTPAAAASKPSVIPDRSGPAKSRPSRRHRYAEHIEVQWRYRAWGVARLDPSLTLDGYMIPITLRTEVTYEIGCEVPMLLGIFSGSVQLQDGQLGCYLQ